MSHTETRTFCPLVLFHDYPSNRLTLPWQSNQYRGLINEHRAKTTEMLEQNAQLWWWKRQNTASLFSFKTSVLRELFPANFSNDFRTSDVLPDISTSSTTNSSSSSGDSLSTTLTSPTITPLEPLTRTSTPPPLYHSKISAQEKIMHLHHEPSAFCRTLSLSPPLSITDISAGITESAAKVSIRSDADPPVSITTTSNNSNSSGGLLPSDSTAKQKRRRGNLPKDVTEFLKRWLVQHKKHPYPTEKEKMDLAYRTGLTVNQISNWFINARRRILQPMLESENQRQALDTSAYYELIALEEKRRRQFDAYAHQGFAGINEKPFSWLG
ncbi:uncharacterized protein BYT42DRAFT_573673 [Radiomyces spectabilis]|uniref:uncharacterized protein n=1 Tax=Radiomyces spectabilis TaxID=64574 RepID=UPI00221ECD43|nr:uncharacterized protein BYT42DRAFT_573673 [Radiomyces spectabilis]KAI8376169.1 hypothetical protein BYT42DRAFT_573673 [Radiomyces spectabilis]